MWHKPQQTFLFLFYRNNHTSLFILLTSSFNILWLKIILYNYIIGNKVSIITILIIFKFLIRILLLYKIKYKINNLCPINVQSSPSAENTELYSTCLNYTLFEAILCWQVLSHKITYKTRCQYLFCLSVAPQQFFNHVFSKKTRC